MRVFSSRASATETSERADCRADSSRFGAGILGLRCARVVGALLLAVFPWPWRRYRRASATRSALPEPGVATEVRIPVRSGFVSARSAENTLSSAVRRSSRALSSGCASRSRLREATSVSAACNRARASSSSRRMRSSPFSTLSFCLTELRRCGREARNRRGRGQISVPRDRVLRLPSRFSGSHLRPCRCRRLWRLRDRCGTARAVPTAPALDGENEQEEFRQSAHGQSSLRIRVGAGCMRGPLTRATLAVRYSRIDCFRRNSHQALREKFFAPRHRGKN